MLADTLAERSGVRPVVVGASLGGMAALLAEGGRRATTARMFSALVLVDITPRVDIEGVAKIQGFMRANAREGFATRSPRPRMRSRPICRTGRARAPTRG